MKNRKIFIENLVSQVQLVGVSKHRNIDEISQCHEDGVVIFGENRVQELLSKYEKNQPWDWHFIGHLQRNKVNAVVSMCSMIQSVDSLRLAEAINKAAKANNKVMDVLIQVNVLNEASKFGCALKDVDALVQFVHHRSHMVLRGFMIMGPTNQSKKETTFAFEKGFELFKYYKSLISSVDTLSMGMSNDYELAIKHGATMVRLGSLLFTYSKNAQPQ